MYMYYMRHYVYIMSIWLLRINNHYDDGVPSSFCYDSNKVNVCDIEKKEPIPDGMGSDEVIGA